jgi:hypothetical protein
MSAHDGWKKQAFRGAASGCIRRATLGLMVVWIMRWLIAG